MLCNVYVMTCGTMGSWMGAVEMLWTYFSHKRLLFINDKVYTNDYRTINATTNNSGSLYF